MDKAYGIVYLLTNTVNGKVYVGQTTKSVDERFKKHVKDALRAGRKYPIHNAIRKYGVAAFRKDMLVECVSQDDLNTMERKHIDKYRARYKKSGYNLAPGGHVAHTPESRRKISLAMKGRRLSVEHRRNLSVAHIGKKQSAATVDKRRQKLLGRPRPTEVIERIRANARCKRKVVQLDGEDVRVYESIHDASRAIVGDGSGCGNISHCCNGRYKTAYGFAWRWRT